jgi:GNAT superfamily N-acetyltransferase
MSDLVVRPVASRRQRGAFVGFPWDLYRNDPNWIPPLRAGVKELLNYRHHPYYERNEIQTFLAYRGGEVCGRIAAIVDQGYIEKFKERRGYFGFFECVDDAKVAAGLFDAARQWLADRDIHRVRGPLSPGLNYEIGLLVEGFDTPPTFLIPHNPPYYAQLIEGCGFHQAQDLYSFTGKVSRLGEVQAKRKRVSEQIQARYGITVRPMNKKRFVEDVRMFLDIYNRSLVAHWSFVPLSPAEMMHMAKGLSFLIVPELALAAEIDGRTVGAVFALPDYNPRIKKIDGRLFPFGVFRLLWRKRKIPRLRILAANTLPEYQLMGIGLVLAGGLVPKILDWGIEEVEFSWVAQSNALSRGSLEKGGAVLSKTHRVYDLDP